MELVFRGKENEFYDMYLVLQKDCSVEITIRSKNATGESRFTLLPKDFDRVCEIRQMLNKDAE